MTEQYKITHSPENKTLSKTDVIDELQKIKTLMRMSNWRAWSDVYTRLNDLLRRLQRENR